MTQSNQNERNAGKVRSLLWGVAGGMAFCATMMIVMMLGGHKLMGGMGGKMKGMMEMCGDAEDPIDVLKRRYAAGEVSREDFEQIRQELET
jgi:uncharacterized membrane protein